MPRPSADDPIESLPQQLADALAGVLGPVEVHSLRRLTGGASRETWSFDAVAADGTLHELVLRRDPPGRPGPRGSMALEAAAIRLASGAGVPVPEVLVDHDEAAPWGSAGMVMRRVAGEALGRRILRDDAFGAARDRLVGQFGAALAALHSVPADRLGAAPEFDPLDAMRAVLDELGEPVPTFEYALDWLARHRPASHGRAVVHGDFRLGNLLVGPEGLTAVLDWELVHLGDPVEDLGWCCVRAWRFGGEPPVAGLGTRERLLEAYEAAGGSRVEAEVLRWWEAYGTLRWGVICLTQTSVHLRGALRSVELAAIGRRVCETEWDLCCLLVPDAARAARAAHDARGALGSGGAWPSTSSTPGLHGRPSAAELVEAVREFLSDQVVAGTQGAVSYHARVASNVLGMVERELAAGAAPVQRRALDLARLGVQDEAGLCAALRAGGLGSRHDEFVEVLVAGVVERLAVANPRYLA